MLAFVGRREGHLKVYYHVFAKHSASRSLIPQDLLSHINRDLKIPRNRCMGNG